MKVSMGKTAWKSKPNGQMIGAVLSKASQYDVVDKPAKEIFRDITSGRCWRSGLYKEGATTSTKSSFSGAQVIALDFDETETTPQELVEYSTNKGLEPNFWYYSFSQGIKPNYNYRIVWVLDEVIQEVDYEVLYERILSDSVFSQADHNTKDISRLWIGTNKGGVFIKETPISIEAFKSAIPYVLEGAKKRGIQSRKSRERIIVSDNQEEVIIPTTFEWWRDLKHNCELWNDWISHKYLEYNKRLKLWFNLKAIRYTDENGKELSAEDSKTRTLDIIMRFYDVELYKTSKCNKTQIETKLYDKTGIAEPIVYNNAYTVSSWYRQLFISEKLIRQSLEDEDREMDKFIPQVLNESGIKYVECQTESGKTERILQYLAKQDYTQRKIIYAVPTYILIQEARERAKRMGLTDIKTPQKIDYTKEDEMYLMFAFVNGVKRTQQMIERKKEIDEVINAKTGLFIITHSLLAHIPDVEADIIIVDENIEDCLCSRHRISEDVLVSLLPYYDTIYDGKGNEIDGKPIVERLYNFIHANKRGTKIDYNTFELNKVFFGFKVDLAIKRLNPEKAQDIGMLDHAENISIGEYADGMKYVYFENPSKILRIAYTKHIPLKLFTGTPKINQLRASLKRDSVYGAQIIEEIGEQVKITRANTTGSVFRFSRAGATGSKASIQNGKTIEYAIDVLDDLEIDWRNINCLTLKSCVDIVRKAGFKIPQIEVNGEKKDLYIENCAGYDGLKGEDLIVIGKPDIELTAYLDMIDIEDGESTELVSKVREIEDTGKVSKQYGYVGRLWDLQAEQIRERLEQAVGRARALRYPCNVYVFADYALRNEYSRSGNNE